MTEVKVGQKWKRLDARRPGTITVKRIEGNGTFGYIVFDGAHGREIRVQAGYWLARYQLLEEPANRIATAEQRISSDPRY